MRNRFFLPNRFKRIGYFILIPATIGLVLNSFGYFEPAWLNIETTSNIKMSGIVTGTISGNNSTNEILIGLFLIGVYFAGFSKEKNEDDLINMIRLNSLSLAFLLNAAFIFIANFVFYGLDFLRVLIYNIFTPFIIYLLCYNFMLYRFYKNELFKSDDDEEQHKSGESEA